MPILALLATLLALPANAATLAYVANALDGTVSVVDLRTGATRATIPVGCDPRSIVAHPDGSRVYVANACSSDSDAAPGSVSVIDTDTNSVVDTFATPFGPVAIALDAARDRLYAACLVEEPFSDEDSSGALYVADLATGSPVDMLPLFLVPLDLALTADGTRVFVSGVAGARDDEDTVHLTFSGVVNVDPAGLQGGPTYHGASGSLAVDPSGARLYVTDRNTADLAVVDTATATEVTRVPVGIAAQDVVPDWRRKLLFVSSTGDNPNLPPDAVTVIDTRTNTVAKTFDGGWAPTRMAPTPHNRLLLVPNFYAGELLVMRARSGRLLRTIPTGLGAAAVAVVRR